MIESVKNERVLQSVGALLRQKQGVRWYALIFLLIAIVLSLVSSVGISFVSFHFNRYVASHPQNIIIKFVEVECWKKPDKGKPFDFLNYLSSLTAEEKEKRSGQKVKVEMCMYHDEKVIERKHKKYIKRAMKDSKKKMKEAEEEKRLTKAMQREEREEQKLINDLIVSNESHSSER
ncbi:unnamed protein product [Bursaphelenchus okinawaensis]|uniref:Uncharacterized protein n=1 Tax=Bursaphelenchus okinawaensis TaxID=465554 RepID=A0A811JQM2_9BILA|nr:unnamed protein product [Bursaphelenchus okinawaensis]CAG9077557.1 unnamed protein product [Bursaphelenchus okinawaensis]